MNHRIAVIGLLLIALTATGCSNATEGALSGAGIGALSGLAIGSLSGDAGKGAAIGAMVGGVGGAVIGDQNRRKDEAARAQNTNVTVVNTAPPAYSTGAALGRLVGQWRISGTIESADGKSTPISGTAQGVVDKTYFVRLDVHLRDPRSGNVVDGTSVISQNGGRGLDLTNAFSSSPEVKRFRGEMDSSGTVFTLKQIEPSGGNRRIIIRLTGQRDWSADGWDGDNKTESMTFTWVGA